MGSNYLSCGGVHTYVRRPMLGSSGWGTNQRRDGDTCVYVARREPVSEQDMIPSLKARKRIANSDPCFAVPPLDSCSSYPQLFSPLAKSGCGNPVATSGDMYDLLHDSLSAPIAPPPK
jgi:hypothetical protein